MRIRSCQFIVGFWVLMLLASLGAATTNNVSTATQLASAVVTASAASSSPANPYYIVLAQGTYNLVGTVLNIDPPGGCDIIITADTANGGTAANTVINQNGAARCFLINPSTTPPNVIVSFISLTIQGGFANDGFAGAAIISGGNVGNVTSLTNCLISGNHSTFVTAGDGNVAYGGAINQGGGGNLNLSGCTLANNSADGGGGGGGGGAIYFTSQNASDTLTLVNCSFSTNSCLTINQGGGAVMLDAVANKPTATITNCQFLGNQSTIVSGGVNTVGGGAIFVLSGSNIGMNACTFEGNSVAAPNGTADGGAVYAANGNSLDMRFCRLLTNSISGRSLNGSTLFFANVSGLFTADNNWWGTNSIPAGILSGVSPSHSLVLSLWPNPSAISTSATTIFTADFTTNSAGQAISPSNLGALIGVPVSFGSAVDGNLSLAQGSIQPSGTATVEFSPTSAGTGSASATVDAETIAAPVTIFTTVNSITRLSPVNVNLNSVSWTVSLNDSVTGVSASDFGLAAGPGVSGASITGVTGSGAVYTVTAGTGTGDGTLGLNMVNNAGVSAQVNNLTFDGEIYVVDKTAPTISIGAPSIAITNGTGSVSFPISYADANFNSSSLTPGAVSLNSTGTANGNVSVDTGTGASRTVTLSGLTGNGTLGISIATGTASDLAGNTAPSGGPSATFIVDTTPPGISISAPSVPVTLNGPVSYTVGYSDLNFNGSSLTAGAIQLNTTGTATGTPQVTGGGASWTVTLSSITGSGSIGISIASGTSVDLAGNADAGGGPSTTFAVDAAPTITGTAAGQNVTDNSAIDPFSGVTIGDVDVPAQTLSISVVQDDAAKGSLTTLSGFNNAGGGVYTFSGTASAATAAIQGMVFTPTPNRVLPGNSETTGFSIVANDGFLSVTNGTTTVVAFSVNDPPSFTIGPNEVVQTNVGPQTINGWVTSITGGPGIETNQTVSFVVTNDNNALFSVQPSVDASGTLTFTPASGAASHATLWVIAHDNGGTAQGGVDTSAAQKARIKVMVVPIQSSDRVVADRGPYLATGAVLLIQTNGNTQVILTTLLKDPYTVALDRNGDILVADYQTGKGPLGGGIFRLNQYNMNMTTVSTSANFSTPFGIAVETSGNLLVADLDAQGSGVVFRVNPGTGVATSLSSGNNFFWLAGIALAPDGTIYVTDHGDGASMAPKLIRIDPTTGAQTVVSSGGNFMHPDGMVVIPSTGNIVVADAVSKMLIEVDAGTGAQTVISSDPQYILPTHVAIDTYSGQYIVTDGSPSATVGERRIYSVDPHTGVATILTSDGFFDQPRGVLVEP